MGCRTKFSALFVVLLAGRVVGSGMTVSSPAIFSGMCDASAAVALSDKLFVVASDEDNILRVYKWDQPGPPVEVMDFSAFLQVDSKSPETDLEGAARIGNRIYWITSHGRNQNGRRRLSRERFFATELREEHGRVRLEPLGRPYKNLLRDLIDEPRLKPFRLAEASRLAPKLPKAFNIEGLCSTPEGQLLIGFRNPIPQARALLVPLVNPAEVSSGRRARFGDPILLDLGGLGIREVAQHEGRYLIIAGHFDGGGKVRLYEWDGRSPHANQLKDLHFGKFNAEAVVFYPDLGWKEFQILSDDGAQLVGGKRCKDLKDPWQRTFRALWVREFVPGPSLPDYDEESGEEKWRSGSSKSKR